MNLCIRSPIRALTLLLLVVPACSTPMTPGVRDVGTAAVDMALGDAARIDSGGGSPDANAVDANMSVDSGSTRDAFTPSDSAVARDAFAATDTGRVGTGTFGGSCTTGADCASGVCWDFSAIDPLCFGRGCSVGCTTDAECRNAATAAGAPTPGAATCTPTTHTCDLQGTGLVPIACA